MKLVRFLPALLLVAAGVAQAQLRVVQIAPLSGPLAGTGKQLQQGAQLAFAEANAAGGVHGQKIVFETLDDAYKAEESVRLAREVAKRPEKPVALLGLVGTGNVAALIKEGIVDEIGVPVIGVRTGASSLRQPGHPLVYHLRASYAAEVEKLVEVASTIGNTRFGVMYQNDPFGQDGLQAVQRALDKRKLPLLASAGYEKNTTKVEAAVETLLKAPDLQAIVLVSNSQATATFVKAYREKGGLAQLYALSVNNDREVVAAIGAERARGLGITQVVPFPTSGVMPVTRAYQGLLKKYQPDAEPSVSSMEGYLYGKVLVEALKRAGPKPTTQGLVKALSAAPFELGGYQINFTSGKHEGSDFVELTMIGAGGKLIR
ncbi:ABC transporter substrate-binding protein [Dechloromonas sp. XY25]|uniref:ABC transporter substrate-binding protein n=1 Tax=Dechloromonas hankyongensis TaxID=2908002 RepID=A0ABS9K572_9RHOO|nr:ABC transporter substrate-binding protein [Dechloromonas hankyongensis]MCG2578290.1 ABC transporter substrate-binding protein [Dechloromonas hankyongensis]